MERVIFRQYYLGCLSQASYLVGDEAAGVGAVVDPQRDVAQYLADAEALGLRLRYVIETHLHADFVSGHLELADRTGAEICYGQEADVDFPIRRLGDGERLALGSVVLEVRATPGHTPESISVVVYEREGDAVPYGVLTGDTLFVGDVGRPDLLASGPGTSPEAMARQLYRSLRSCLLTLPDGTRVYPAHGAGSACGRNLSTETSSTLGEQRATNWALAPMTEDEFVHALGEGQPLAPPYFSYDAQRNREWHPLLDEEPPPALDVDDLLKRAAAGAVMVDTRRPEQFAVAHLAGSVNIGLEGRFSENAGCVLRPDDTVVLVADPGSEREAKVRLARTGFDSVQGHLAEPERAFLERPDAVAFSSRLTAGQLQQRLGAVDGLVVLDVRGPGEQEAGMVGGAVALPLTRLAELAGGLDPEAPTVVYCAGGYRSSVAASYLRAKGFTDVSDLIGGYGAWKALVESR